MVERAAATWTHLRLNRVSDGTTLHASANDFGSILTATQFFLPAVFAISPLRALRYFSGAVLDRSDGSCAFKHGHLFCAAVQAEINLRVTKD